VVAAPTPPVSALALVLQPNKERPVAVSVEGLRHPHQQLQVNHHQQQHQRPPLKVALLSIPPVLRMSATGRENSSSVANVSALLTARADAALVPPAFALALVLQPRLERPVAVSVVGLRHPHQQLQVDHHRRQHQQLPLKVALLSILPAPRTSATGRENNSSVVNAPALLTARADVALVPPAFALALVLQPRLERLVVDSKPSVSLV